MKNRYLLLTIAAALGWGFCGTCSEHLFKTYQTDGLWLTTTRLIIAGSLLILITLATEGSKNLVGILRSRDRRQLLIFALLGMMTVQLSYLMAIKYTNSATATVIQYSGPAFILLYVCMKVRRFPTWQEDLSLVGIVVGVFLIATHGHLNSLVISRIGLIWGIASAIFLAAHDILPLGIIKNWGAMTVTGLSMLIGGLALALATWPFDYSPTICFDSVATYIAMILLGTIFPFTAFLAGVSHIGPVKASITSSIEPIATAIFSFLWIGTRIGPIEIAGMAIILVSVFVINVSPAKPKSKK